MTMTQETRHEARELDRLLTPLARALGAVRETLAGWDAATIRDAGELIARHSAEGSGDADLIAAEAVLVDALIRAHAGQLVRSARQLDVTVSRDSARWTLSASAEHTEVVRRQFDSEKAALEAGEALHELLKMQGRAGEFFSEWGRTTNNPFAPAIPF
jgi:hypothetical protein